MKMTEIHVGQRAEFTKKVTDDDIRKFAVLSGDYNPIHLDDDYAASTMFKGRIAHGVISVGIISSVIANKLPGPGSILMEQNIRYTAPVRPGDEITASVEVISVSEKGKIELKAQCANQNGEVVISGSAKVLYRK